MEDYIVFTVAGNYYAINVASVERIIQIPPLTAIPNAHPCIEGMISYERRVTKVVNFRKMTDLPTYEAELVGMFKEMKKEHEIWVKNLFEAVTNGKEFLHATDSHACKLGKWLDVYSTHDSDISAIIKQLRLAHVRLYEIGREALTLRQKDPEGALAMLKRDIEKIFESIMGQISKLIEISDRISSHLQKLLIYRDKESVFAIKVDTIEEMARIDGSMVKSIDMREKDGTFIETAGVVEMDSNLVNIIKSVSLPVREGVLWV